MERKSAGTLHMIGNAHLDPVWLWQWQEGFQETKATFRSVLDLMDENEDFVFTSSSAAMYAWIEHNDPGMFEEIHARIQEGRWEIAGGWWIQPDCNLPSGESFVRQGLYGQRYFREKLGVTASVGYNVDSFGHAGSLPQILLKSGLSRYVFMRPHPEEMTLPSRLFWWESADGSRVLTFRIPYEYCTWGQELQQHVRRCESQLGEHLNDLMCFYGVGNHGGGPTRQNLASIRDMQNDPSYPRLVFSSTQHYFAAVESSASWIPVVRDELQHHASGCYAAHSGIKRWNRQAENLLMTAETLSSVAWGASLQPYPKDFDRAWKSVLFNQFHDILAGTSIEPAYDDARNAYGEAMTIAARHLNNATQALMWNMKIEPSEGARSIVVFNPHSWSVTVPVELEFGKLNDNDVLFNSDGQEVPWQRVRSLASVSGGRNRLAIGASVPACGWEVYRLAPAVSSAEHPRVLVDSTSLENDDLRLEIDPLTGNLTSLHDKRSNFQYLRGQAARPLVIDDPSDTWSHGVLWFDRVIGEFAVRSVRLLEHGSVKSTLRVESGFGHSRLTQDFTMYPAATYVDVHVTVDWREQFRMLKLNFPLHLDFTTVTYETPYGHIQRATNGEEEPGQSWVDITGIGRNNGRLLGLSVLNDAKYSFSVKNREFNLTVLRSPIYAHHVPHEPEPGRSYTFIDQGVQRFTYTLYPHVGRWEDGGTPQRAAELNRPAFALAASPRPGSLPARGSYLAVSPSNVVVSVIKRSEDRSDLILRCFETTGQTTLARIDLPHWERTIESTFRPGEIKTFRVPMAGDEPVRETNLIEWDE